MLLNKKNFSSASNIFFQSRYTSVPAWLCNTQLAVIKMTEINTTAALAVATEFCDVARQYLLADSPQALLAQSQSRARHWRAMVSGSGGDELAEIKTASRQWSIPVEKAEKKLPAVVSPALTLSDCANMGPGSDVLRLKLAIFDVADVTDVTDFTEIGDPTAGPGGSVSGPRHD